MVTYYTWNANKIIKINFIDITFKTKVKVKF